MSALESANAEIEWYRSEIRISINVKTIQNNHVY